MHRSQIVLNLLGFSFTKLRFTLHIFFSIGSRILKRRIDAIFEIYGISSKSYKFQTSMAMILAALYTKVS